MMSSVHHCSASSVKKDDDDNWLEFLLSFGLKQTLSNPNQSTRLKNGNRLLTRAKLNDSESPLSFPRSVSVMNNGLIAVCDSGNNRIIGFNIGGIQTFSIKQYSIQDETFPFSSPLSVCAVGKLYFAIANYGNSVVNLITSSGVSERVFICQSNPICLTSGFSNTILVLTKSQTIECFSLCGERLTTITINDEGYFTLMTVNTARDEIYLSESHSNEIFVINKAGSPLRRMKLYIPGSGLHVFINSIYFINNRILVSDSVNRCISVFNSSDGGYTEIVLNGKSGLGCVQAAVISRDNKLVAAEYSLNEPHMVKIFSCNLH